MLPSAPARRPNTCLLLLVILFLASRSIASLSLDYHWWSELGQKGMPQQITVKKSLGLDEKAIEAVQKWRFKPGMKDGKPVAVQVLIDVSFHLL